MIDIKADSDVLENAKNHNFAVFLYTVSYMHCLQVGTGKQNEGEKLGMMWGKQKQLKYLKKAGFENIEIKDIP